MSDQPKPPQVVRYVGVVCPVLVVRTSVSVEPSFELGKRWVAHEAGIYAGAASMENLQAMANFRPGVFKSGHRKHGVVGTMLVVLHGADREQAVALLQQSNPSVVVVEDPEPQPKDPDLYPPEDDGETPTEPDHE